MATEQGTSTTIDQSASSVEWASWGAAILGLWTAVSAFVLTGSIGSGNPLYSNVIAGILIAALAGFAGYSIRSSIGEWQGSPVEWSSWLSALGGIWILATPFVLTGEIASGTPMYSNVIVGLVVMVLAGYAGWTFHDE